MIRQLLLAVTAGCLLSACATSYQSLGLTGGHIDQKGPGKLEAITFSANGFTEPALAQKYALYRCAELAKAKHKPFFLMYNSLIAAARNDPTGTPRVGQALGKPTATAFVLLLDASEPGARNTNEVLNELKSVVDTGALEKS